MEGGANIAEALRQAGRMLRVDARAAAAQARAALAVAPASPDALRLLAAALRRSGDDEAAERAELDAIAASVAHPLLIRAAEALLDNDLPAAEQLLRPRLREKPTDVAAIRMMAELAARLGRYADAENLLRRALELAPAWGPARANLATVLYKQNRPEEAVAELDRLDGVDEESHRNLRAAALGRLGAYQEAIALYEAVLARTPRQPKIWMSLGHLLKTVGRGADGIAAYRRAIALAPGLGEAWWSLANLKTIRFGAGDVAAMERALDRSDLGDDDRFHLHFALGKAQEDGGEPDRAFVHYAEGNRLRRAMIDYDPDEIAGHVARSIALFTPDFLAERAGWGCLDPDPIFILGMPRAGSTLVEQILASHPEVEGTMELPDIPMLARRLNGRKLKADPSLYPEMLAGLSAAELRAMGEEYLRATRVQRKTAKPFFLDKMPNNWAHVGLIRLILPNARIVDARRHPLACGFSNFKQHFARGQGFSYDLADMGRYYRDYVALMGHFDTVQPDAVVRVIHEDLVEAPEAGIRALLDALGLPFDPACLAFHENARAVRTASAEQVRRPINREGLESWRAFAAHLGPLERALGPALENWR